MPVNVLAPGMKEKDPALELVASLSMLSPRADPPRKVSVEETQARLPCAALAEASALICENLLCGDKSLLTPGLLPDPL